MLLQKANALWSKIPIRYLGAALIAIPAISLTAAMAVWVVSQRINSSIYLDMERSRNQLAEVKNLLIDLLNAETGTRGFALTRDPKYLEPYHLASQHIPITLAKLKQGENEASERDKIAQIEDLSQGRLKFLTLIVNSTKTASKQRDFPYPELGYISEGKQVMDRLRILVEDLEAEESQKLDKYEQRLDRNRETSNIIVWIASCISLLVYLKLLYLISTLDWRLAGQELELSESNSLLKTAMDNVVDGVITLNENGEINSFNSAASVIFGCSLEEAMNSKIDNFISGDISQKEIAAKDGVEPVNIPFLATGHRKTGSDFPIEISVSKLPYGDRKMLIFRDITQRLEAQKKLENNIKELSRLSLMLSKTNQDLIERNQELDQFAYVASHDLKAPLRAIFSLSEWMEEDLADKLTPETQHQMQLLRQRVSRMEALIKGLLEYCRVGRVEARAETVDVGLLVKEVVDSLGIPSSFRVDIASNLPILSGKSLLLRQVFSNLISNAVKHHQSAAGEVKISFQELDTFYEFSVTDDGVGIAPEYQEQIFRIFQTLEARDTSDNTGVGLAIVKKIVESEGGKIRVESEVGKGSTFRFTWRKLPKERSSLSLQK